MKIRSFSLTAAVALGISLFGARDGHAYRYLTCNQDPIRWAEPFGMTQNECSVPTGSAVHAAYLNALSRYSGVAGAQDMVFHQGATPANDCVMDNTDGVNDFGMVAASTIDGALGRTISRTYCEEIVESNIYVASGASQSFNNPDEAFAVGTNAADPMATGQFAVLHEFGHAHGLSMQATGLPDQHVTGLAVMRASPPSPLIGGLNLAHSRLFPDEAAGLRFLYPSFLPETNVMASSQRLSGSSIVNTAPTITAIKCRGDAFTYDWTTANRGTSSVTTTQRFYLAAGTAAHSQSGVTLATWPGVVIGAQSHMFGTLSTSIPCGTAPGTYRLYHKADSTNVLAENSEVDNVAYNAMTVQVLSCGCQ